MPEILKNKLKSIYFILKSLISLIVLTIIILLYRGKYIGEPKEIMISFYVLMIIFSIITSIERKKQGKSAKSHFIFGVIGFLVLALLQLYIYQ